MGKARNLQGQVFDRLKVQRATEERDSSGSIIWECLCRCGKTSFVSGRNLTSGKVRSCGCLKTELLAKRFTNDLTDRPFGQLKAIRPTDKRNNGSVVWECQCTCGNVVLVRAHSLMDGNTKSCGCLNVSVARSRAIEKASVDTVDQTRLSYLNKTVFTNNTSGHRGVCFHKKAGKWAASIGFQGNVYYLGLFPSIEGAILAREIAEDALWRPLTEQYLGCYSSEEERKEKLKAYLQRKIEESQGNIG